MFSTGLVAYLRRTGILVGLLSLLYVFSAAQCEAAAPDPAAPAATLPMRETRAWDKSLSRSTPVPEWVDKSVSAPEESGTYPLALRLADTQIYLDKEPVVYVHRMMQANESSMLSTVGNFEIVFQPEYQHVDLHSVRVIRAGREIDKTASVDIRFLQREQEFDVGIYTGAVSAAIVVDDVRTGDIVDIAYSITGQNPVFGGKYFHSVYVDALFPTRYRHVLLNAPRDRTIYRRIFGNDHSGVAVREELRGDRKIVRFSAENLLPVDYERYAPLDAEQFRVVQFSEFNDWRHVAQWASTLFESTVPPAAIKDVLASLRQVRDPDRTVQKALEYVQKEVRYLSVSLGENSHRPFPPDVVLARRYGDCKDKSLLLVTLLRQLGFDASPVLLSVSSRTGLDKVLPSPQVFDHAIVRVVVDGKAYFLDPTRSAQHGTLAAMGQAHAGADVLVVRPDTTRLTTIPVDASTKVLQNMRTERIVIRQMDGPAELTVVNRYAGLEAELARYYVARQTSEQLQKGFVATIARRYPSAELISGPTVSDDKQGNMLTVELHFRIPHFLENVDTGWRMRYETSNLKNQFYIPDNPRRRFPLSVPGYPGSRRYEMELTLPADFDANYKPSEAVLQNAAFRAVERLSFQGRVIKATLDVQSLNDRVQPADVPQLMTDVSKLEGMMESSLTIRKTDLKQNAARVSADMPLKDRIATQLGNVVARSSSRIMDASSTGGSAASDLCERAVAYAQLGQRTEALADVAAAIKIEPLSGTTLLCRAEVNLFLGDTRDSETDFTRAFALGAANGRAYWQRGIAYYASGKWKEAAQDFEQAYQRLGEPHEKTKADIMRVLALRRSNSRTKAVPHVEVRYEWPDVVLGVLDGTKTDEDVLRQIHHRIGDELEYALSEAYFYLGQAGILAGNKVKATAYLQRSIDKGIAQSEFRTVARKDVEQLRK